MAIPASKIVSVNPRLLTAAGTDLEFNGLLLSTSEYIPESQFVLAFSDADSVGDYFGYYSEEYKAASVYFEGYDNSFAKPRALYIAKLVGEAVAPFIRGGGYDTTTTSTLKTLQAVTSGDLTLMLGGYTGTITGVDFSEATTLSGVAEILEEAINAVTAGGESWTAATVTYSSLFDAFTITGGVAGEGYGVDYASGSVAEAMLLTEDSGAVLSEGLDALEVSENMQKVLDETSNFVCFTTVEEPDEETALALAEWADDQGVAYLYIYWDTDEQLLNGSDSTIAAALTEAGYGATCGVYGTIEYAAMIMGTAGSIDWDRRNGTITFAFKAQDGLAALVTTSADATVLEEANMNYIGNWATRNDEFVFLYPGTMFGDWQWIDTYLNAIWLNSALQTAIMNGFSQTGRVPYNERGYTLIRSWCMDPINRALYNGVIDTGITLSQSQITELYQEAGSDISSTLETDGYVLQIGYDEDDSSSTEASVRQNRESPEASLWYTYGGSIHKLELATTAVV